MKHKSVRYALMALGILASLFFSANFLFMPKNHIYWERQLWIAPVLLASVCWAGVIYLFPKSDPLWTMKLLGTIAIGALVTYAAAYALQFLRD